MATTKAIKGQVVGSDGGGRAAIVRITLSAPAFVNGNEEVLASPLVITSGSDGVYRANLWSNADLTPANTFYTVQEADQAGGGTNTFTIHVPQTAGPFDVASITP